MVFLIQKFLSLHDESNEAYICSVKKNQIKGTEKK